MYYIVPDSKYYYYHKGTWYPAQDPNFEIGALYYWNTEKGDPYWQKVATVESNSLNRAISQIRQSVTDKANEYEVSLIDTRGSVSSVKQTVNNIKSDYVTTTKFEENMTQISQESTDNAATLKILAMSGIKPYQGDASCVDVDTVYYDKETELYHYAYLNEYDCWVWQTTDDPSIPEITSKIKSAGIITAINGDTSNVKISGCICAQSADKQRDCCYREMVQLIFSCILYRRQISDIHICP